MRVMSKKSGILVLLATSAMTMAAAVSAQSPEAAKADITVNGTPIPDASQMTPGP